MSLDRDEIVRGNFDIDVVGHYVRPDVFRLNADERPTRPAAGLRLAVAVGDRPLALEHVFVDGRGGA
jgi:hypothetical protein